MSIDLSLHYVHGRATGNLGFYFGALGTYSISKYFKAERHQDFRVRSRNGTAENNHFVLENQASIVLELGKPIIRYCNLKKQPKYSAKQLDCSGHFK